jgi:N-sulfoglucosamine sulfohydrolase
MNPTKTLISLAWIASIVWAESQQAGPPNIVFFLADDWGRVASCYADPNSPSVNDVVKTPNIDRLAKEGVRFNNAFFDCPQCTPSRAAIASGSYFWRCGSNAFLNGTDWQDKTKNSNPPDPFTSLPRFPSLLAKAGYATAKSFKTIDFKPTIPGTAGFHSYLRYGIHVSAGKSASEKQTRRQAVIDQTRESLQNVLTHCPPEKPFFYVFGPINTHRPFVPGSGQALWEIHPDSLKGKLPAYLPDVPEVRTDFADYLGEVQALDLMVGIFMEELEKSGRAENTLIVLTGDNGMPGVPHGKTQLYDLGTRAPLFMRWPAKIAPNQTLDAFVTLKDLAATFLEAGGLTPPSTLDARSLMPLLLAGKNGTAASPRDAAIFGRERHSENTRTGNLPYPARAIRTAEFLYIRNFKPERWPFGEPIESGKSLAEDAALNSDYSRHQTAPFRDMDAGLTKGWLMENRSTAEGAAYYQATFAPRPLEELYDVRKDPDQLHNLADSPAHQPHLKQLAARLLKVQQDTHDPRLENAFDHPPYVESIHRSSKP